MPERNLTQNQLKRLFAYDADSGDFTRKIKRGHRPAGSRVGHKHHGGGRCYYWRVRIGGKHYAMHRLAWLYVYGEWPDGAIDHIDHNGLNNSINNLRVIHPVENFKNARRSTRNKSGITGIAWDKQWGGGWTAYIHADGERKHLYYGRDFFEACCARKSAERKFGYHPNHGEA